MKKRRKWKVLLAAALCAGLLFGNIPADALQMPGEVEAKAETEAKTEVEIEHIQEDKAESNENGEEKIEGTLKITVPEGVKAGEIFEVIISLECEQTAKGFSMELCYDTEKVEMYGETPYRSDYYICVGNNIVEESKFKVSAADPDFQSSSGELFTATFRAKENIEAGSTILFETKESDIGAGDGISIQVAEITAEVMVEKGIAGISKNISWSIDGDGLLEITGTGDWERHAREGNGYGDGYYAPWDDYRESVKSAKVTLSEVTDLSYMFYGFENLTNVDLSGLDASKLYNERDVFTDCSHVDFIVAPKNVGDDTYIALPIGIWVDEENNAYPSLPRNLETSITLHRGDVSGVNNHVSWSIDGNGHLEVTGSGDWEGDYVGWTPWSTYRGCIKSAKVSLSGATNLSHMFSWCENMESVDLSELDTSNVTDMSGMFEYCSKLKDLDVSGFNTENVYNMTEMFDGCHNLENLDVKGFNTRRVMNIAGMFSGCQSLTSLDVGGFQFSESGVESMNDMFSGCWNLKSLIIKGLDTKNVKQMRNMFSYCSSLTNLDMSSLDTGNVQDMSSMFENCSNLKSLNIKGLDTQNVTNMSHMFSYCGKLENLNIKGFDTQNVTNMEQMFYNCKNLRSLDTKGFNTENVSNMRGLFDGCSSLENLDVSGFDTKNVTNMNHLFAGCSNLKNLDVSGFDLTNAEGISGLFYGCSGLENIDVSDLDTQNITAMNSMFSGCTSLKNLDVSGFDTRNVTDMSWMFSGCNSLTSLDVSNFDTQNVTDMDYMFSGCGGLESLDLSKFNMENVESSWGLSLFGDRTAPRTILTPYNVKGNVVLNGIYVDDNGNSYTSLPRDMTSSIALHLVFEGKENDIAWAINEDGCLTITGTGDYTDAIWNRYGRYIKSAKVNLTGATSLKGLFHDCWNLKEIDLSGLDTENVTDMRSMFENCSDLESLDLTDFYTGNVTNMSSMFENCSGLKNLDVSSLDTSNVTDMSWMFAYSNLTSLDISSLNTGNVTEINDMFWNCEKLETLNMSGLDFGKVQGVVGTFDGCGSLTTIHTPVNLGIDVRLPMVHELAIWQDASEVITWQDSEGNIYTELPKNIDTSITLMRHIESAVKLGDADGNDSITAEDALAILKHVVGSETLTEAALESADVDANNQITAEDALGVLKKVVGAIGSFDEIKVNP